MKNHPTALWRACPAPDGVSWLPWELYQITPLCSDLNPAKWRREAHRWAREDRKAWPGHLIAVRAYEAGPPVHPETMADNYDMPPYV